MKDLKPTCRVAIVQAAPILFRKDACVEKAVSLILEAARLQVKLVCAACGQDGVLGIYANGTVYQPEFYLEAAQMMEDGSLPLLNLVWPGLYRREGGLCAYTEGLRAFGKAGVELGRHRTEGRHTRHHLDRIAVLLHPLVDVDVGGVDRRISQGQKGDRLSFL